jgi:hypothetical protein
MCKLIFKTNFFWRFVCSSYRFQKQPCQARYRRIFHYHHDHAVMVMSFEAKGCVTWCPERLQDKDHTYISGSMDDRITMSSRCLHELRRKNGIYWDFQKPHEVYVPMNQAARQSEVLTNGYGRITEGCTCWNSGQQAMLKWNNHSSLIRTLIKTNEYPLKR